MAPSYSADRDLPGARHSFATAQLALRSLRLTIALKRFNPSQARLPAGSSGGGRWTGSGSAGGAAIQPVSYRPRSRPGGTRVIRGQVYEVTPGQEARLDVSAAQARAAIREVQRHDPTWRPRPSIYEGVEGEIVANQSRRVTGRSAAAGVRRSRDFIACSARHSVTEWKLDWKAGRPLADHHSDRNDTEFQQDARRVKSGRTNR